MAKQLQLKKFENIQALRGLAVTLVITCHLAAIEAMYSPTSALLPQFFNMGAYGVDIFFVISGFIMATITRGKFQNFNNALNFAFNRITRIYPLYWLYTLILFGLITFAHKYAVVQIHTNQHEQFDLLHSLLLIPQQGAPILAVGWTLLYEMYFYGIITLLLFLPERLFVKSVLIWLILIYAVHYLIGPTSPALVIATNPICLEFVAGCLIARLPYSLPIGYNRFILAAGFVLLIASFCFYAVQTPTTVTAIETHSFRIFLFGIPSMLIVYAAVGLEIYKVRLPKFMAKLGDASYSIYLSHVIIYASIGKVWQKLAFANLTFHILMLCLMFAAVICYGFISYNYIEKPLISFFRNLIEPRSRSIAVKVE